MQFISKYITLSQATKSITAQRYGIINAPDADAIEKMRLLCFTIYDPVCDYFGRAIPVSSFYRNRVLNTKIGGSKTSQHMTGEAMDIDCDMISDSKITNSVVFFYIMNNFKFDQLIWEFGTNKNPAWVHVSYSVGNNRNQILVASKDKFKKTVYSPF